MIPVVYVRSQSMQQLTKVLSAGRAPAGSLAVPKAAGGVPTEVTTVTGRFAPPAFHGELAALLAVVEGERMRWRTHACATDIERGLADLH